LFEITDQCSRHKNIDFPGQKHASMYDVNLIESVVRRKLQGMGIDILFYTTAKNVK